MGTPGDKTDKAISELSEETEELETQESLVRIPVVPTTEQSTSSSSNMTVITLHPPQLTTFVDYPAGTSETVSPTATISLEQASIEEYFAQSKYYSVPSESFQPTSISPRTTKTFLSIAEPGPSGLQFSKGKPIDTETKRTKYLTRTAHVCAICHKAFQNPAKLAKHQLSHNGKSPYKCEQCTKTFSSRFKLIRHILIHSDRRPYNCSVCDRTFHRKDHLKNHIKIHSPTKKYYVCGKPTCKKEYTSLLSFKKHTALHAAEEGSLECQICSKTFETKDDILYHLKVHAGSRTVKNPNEKKFTCDYCSRRFFTRKDVRRHLVVHTGMRDFLCQFCPQRFGRKDHLVRHIKKSHSKELSSLSSVKQESSDVKLEVPDEPTPSNVKLESEMIDISDLDVGLFYSEEYGELQSILPSTSSEVHFLPTSTQPEGLESIVIEEIETSSMHSLTSTELIESVEAPQLLEEPVLSDTEIMRLLEHVDEQKRPLPGFSQTFQSPPPPPPPPKQ